MNKVSGKKYELNDMGKYVIDNVENYKEYKNWICGQFLSDNHLQKNSDFEVKFSTNMPGHIEKEHYHPKGKEICILIEGEVRMKIDGKEIILREGDFLYSEGGVHEEILETISPYKIITVRVPSIPDNKIYLNKD